ncbi:SGNH/GDSL hydrolase family protein [Nocardioides sp. 616]|uniref:SGNH/GDSL hydrolase family protein n=1 Tax=Nocardioides sp. 616 TaxID=2268090 RepID=UPI000CE52D89|nr:SGNH/GDSL hydrolase family protein [Nocardioides sp. 616]
MVYIGDSISEGVGAKEWSQRPPVALQDSLRSLHPISAAQGAGYAAAVTFTGLPTPGLKVVIGEMTPVDFWSDNPFGLGSKAVMVDSGTSLTYDFSGTQVRLWYGWLPDGTTADGEVRVDQGPWQPIATDPTPGSGQFWESQVLAPGDHQLELRGTSDTVPTILEGFEVFGSDQDRSAGVHVYDSAHSAYFADKFTGSSTTNGARMWQVIDRIAPVLTVVNLGANDPAWGLSAQQTVAAIEKIVARADLASAGRPHSVLLVVNYTPIKEDPAYAERWQAVREALLSLELDNVATLDLQAWWPELGPGEPQGVMLEEDYPLHPNAQGHALQLSAIMTALMSPSADGR